MASLSYDDAAHLLRRAGFGGSPDEIDGLVARGREGAVDFLVNYSQIDNTAMEELLRRSFDFSDLRNNQRFNPAELRRWWFTRMVSTRRQLEEKMTLFWHNHFATALSKVQEQHMYNQNLTLRAHALDPFDNLVKQVAEDPAMLIWLDGVTNVLGSPNENFGRELMELFTMGINDVVSGQPNYTEDDVKAVARAFTGYKFRVDRQTATFSFFIQPNQHDNTAKTIFGQTLNFTGDDVITVICAKRATARFLVRELFEFFVYPLSSSSADKNTIDKFADVYLASNHSIKSLMSAIFKSDEFFSERARFSLIKQPVELIVGSIRMLGAEYDPGTPERRAQANFLPNSSRVMGQDIFNPPDVDGWALNLGWVNTASMLDRFNFTNTVLTNRNPANQGVFVTSDQLKKYTRSSTKKTVKKFLSLLGPLDVGGETIKTLRDYLERNDQGNKVEFVVDDQTVDKKVRGLVHQIMCLPEYQLN